MIDARPSLSGSFKFLNLGELLQLLGSNVSTGILELRSKYDEAPGLIYIYNGNPIHAVNGSLSGLEAIHSLFGWSEAEFFFFETPVQREQTIHRGRMSIILEGLRLLDEGIIQRQGPVVHSPVASSLPLIKGPLIDYSYVSGEDYFKKGREIVTEKKHGQWIWVVLDGVIEISKFTPKGPVKIIRITNGSFLGRPATLKFTGSVRSASAMAVTDVTLGVINSQQCLDDFNQRSQPYRNLVNSLDKRLRQVTDYTAKIFIGENPVEVILDQRTPYDLPKGDDNWGAFIKKGTAAIIRRMEEGLVPLALLGTDDFLGRVPFMDVGHEPDAALVFGSKDLELEVIDSKGLQKDHNQASTTVRNITEHIITCISVTSSLACRFHKSMKNRCFVNQL